MKYLALILALALCTGSGAAQPASSGNAVIESLADLPVTEVNATTAEGQVLAVMISGDGGWATLDQALSAELASRGIPVAGLNSLKYFWHARTPEQTALEGLGG